MGKKVPQKKETVKRTDERNNGKAFKKNPKIFDPVKRRLVSVKNA
jgi:hypothetical protein